MLNDMCGFKRSHCFPQVLLGPFWNNLSDLPLRLQIYRGSYLMCSIKKVLLKISQLRKHLCLRLFLIKLRRPNYNDIPITQFSITIWFAAHISIWRRWITSSLPAQRCIDDPVKPCHFLQK